MQSIALRRTKPHSETSSQKPASHIVARVRAMQPCVFVQNRTTLFPSDIQKREEKPHILQRMHIYFGI